MADSGEINYPYSRLFSPLRLGVRLGGSDGGEARLWDGQGDHPRLRPIGRSQDRHHGRRVVHGTCLGLPGLCSLVASSDPLRIDLGTVD